MFKKTIFLIFVFSQISPCKLKKNQELCLHCDNDSCTKCINSYLDNGLCEIP